MINQLIRFVVVLLVFLMVQIVWKIDFQIEWKKVPKWRQLMRESILMLVAALIMLVIVQFS